MSGWGTWQSPNLFLNISVWNTNYLPGELLKEVNLEVGSMLQRQISISNDCWHLNRSTTNWDEPVSPKQICSYEFELYKTSYIRVDKIK